MSRNLSAGHQARLTALGNANKAQDDSARGPVRLEATTLRTWILSQPNLGTAKDETDQPSTSSTPKTFQIVDVRDDDYIGGHIPGCLNVPSRIFSFRVEDLVDELKDNEAVVFTCALSQQRGPNVSSQLPEKAAYRLMTIGGTEIFQ